MENILYNSNISYHGIGINIFKMISIMEHGILSYSAANNNGIHIDRNYIGYNGNDFVSLCESPIIHNTFDHGAFRSYVKEGIGLIVNTENYAVFSDRGNDRLNNRGYNIESFNRNSGIPGEIYVRGKIRKEDIIGIMVPQEMLQKPIATINFGFEKMGTGLVDKAVINFVKMLREHFGYEMDNDKIINILEKKNGLENSNLDYFEKNKQEYQIINIIDSYIMSNLSKAVTLKYGVENPTLEFLINKYNVNRLPVYNTDGEIIEALIHQKK